MKRRDFILSALAASAFLNGCSDNSNASAPNLPGGPVQGSVTPLPQPRQLVSKNGLLEVDMAVAMSQNTVGNTVINTRSFNGGPIGPTLRVKPGDTLKINLDNQLGANTDTFVDISVPHYFNTVNIHTHGMHVSPKVPQDNVLLAIEPGQNYSYEYQIPANHPAGTFWYHPHNHGSAAVQLLSGMAGLIIVDGELDTLLAQQNVGESEVILIDYSVDNNGEVPSLANPGAFLGSTTTITSVNGVVTPTMQLHAGEVHRFRIVNACAFNERVIALDGHSFTVLAYDGATLDSPEVVDSIHLSCGGRVDVLITASKAGSYQMQALAYNQGFGDAPAVPYFTLEVLESAIPLSYSLPALSSPYRTIADSEIKRTRQLTFETLAPSTPNFPLAVWDIDGKRFDPTRVDLQMTLGDAEEWTVFNTSTEDHPFHIHVNQFQVTEINGVALSTPRWHDTLLIPRQGSIKFRIRFEDFDGMALIHCHVLLHECQGMMQLFDIAPTGLTRAERNGRLVALQKARKQLDDRQMMASKDTFCAPKETRRLRWT